MYKNLKHYRHTVHLYLDAIWNYSSGKKRARATMYKWLSDQMNLPIDDTHVSKFNREQCRQAIKILRPRYIQLFGHDLPWRKEKNKKMKIKTISKTGYFEAAHLLPDHERGCKNLHGHSYKYTVTISGPQTEPYGMIMDYGDLKKAMEAVMPDHKYLHYVGNEQSEDIVKVLNKYGLVYMSFPFPTSAENMAPYLAELMQEYIHNELGLKDIKVVNLELYETYSSRADGGV